MLKIGLTGNIGSGKSIVSRIFSILAVPIYNADYEAKRIMDSQEVVPLVMDTFGKDIINLDNSVNKKMLAEIVFEDKEKLKKLNAIIHPMVMNDFNIWCQKFSDKKYVINESAILVETGLYKLFDKLITVISPENIRIERVMKRDNCTKNKVLARMNNQLPENDKIKVSDYIITNNESDLLIPQVLLINKTLSE